MKMDSIKCVCSCIRNNNKLLCNIENKLRKDNNNPCSGDIVVVKVLDAKYGYAEIENNDGRLVKLYNGDVWVGVLGNRMSGTNVCGVVPKEEISQGDALELLAQGGMLGKCISVDMKQKLGQATKVEVLGFVVDTEGNIDNIENYSYSMNKNELSNTCAKETIVVFGTSAEAGKTTLVCNLINLMKNKKNVACIKVCGTGRYKDLLAYKDAGAICSDFVDFGLVSTYGVEAKKYIDKFNEMYKWATKSAEIIIIEVGGDILEGNADIVVEISKKNKWRNILVVNDAMGAKYGLQIFGERKVSIFSWKQNTYSLKNRINSEFVYGTSVEEIMDYLEAQKLIAVCDV